MSRERWVLETNLPQEECVRRLKAKLRSLWAATPTPEQPLYGEVTRSGFAVQFRPTEAGQENVNPFYFRGAFMAGAAQTTIQATYGISTALRLFLASLATLLLYLVWRISPLYFWFGMPGAGLQAIFGLVVCAVIFFCYRGEGLAGRFGVADRDPIIGTVADIMEARIREAPEGWENRNRAA